MMRPTRRSIKHLVVAVAVLGLLRFSVFSVAGEQGQDPLKQATALMQQGAELMKKGGQENVAQGKALIAQAQELMKSGLEQAQAPMRETAARIGICGKAAMVWIQSNCKDSKALTSCQMCAMISGQDACMKTGVFPANLEFNNAKLESATTNAVLGPTLLQSGKGKTASSPQEAGCHLGALPKCKTWKLPGEQLLCKIYGMERTQAFEGTYGTSPLGEQEDEDTTVTKMFATGNSDAPFFGTTFWSLPPQHWRFVVALERARQSIVAKLGTGNFIKNGLEGATGGIFCDGTKCYEREDAVAGYVLKHPDRASWKRTLMKAHIDKSNEHNAGCYSYPGNPPIELAVDSWRNVFTSPAKWWKSNDPTGAYAGLTRNCGGQSYCDACACLYLSYSAVKAYNKSLKDLAEAFSVFCPDQKGDFTATNQRYGAKMRAEFGLK